MAFGIFGKKKTQDIDKDLTSVTNEERLKRIIRHVDDMAYMHQDKKQAVTYMIQVIVEGMNHYEAMLSVQYELHEISNETAARENSAVLDIYKDIEHMLFPNKVIRPTSIHEEISINSIPILLNPWKGDRVINSLFDINEDNVFECERHSENIDNTLIKPLNIAVCKGANHSQFAARFKNQGITVLKHEYDLMPLYELVRFDGEGFLNEKTSEYIELKYNKEIMFYAGVLFELGRFLI